MEVYVLAKDAWEYFFDNYSRMRKEIVVIAENKDEFYSVTITEQSGKPFVAVYEGGVLLEGETVVCKADCEDTVSSFYKKYLIPSGLANTAESSDLEEIEDIIQQQEDEIYEREDELLQAFKDFMEVILDDYEDVLYKQYEDEMEEIKEEFIKIVTHDHNFSIRRPMVLEDKSGNTMYVEYPYEDEDIEETLE